MIDHHVHIGPFYNDLMFEPEDVARCLQQCNMRQWYYMSTAFPCVPDNYIEWFKECTERMENAAPGCGKPILWMNEEMLRHSDKYMDNRFHGIKIHEQHAILSPHAQEAAFALAGECNIPLIIHTGENPECHALRYHDLCEKYSSLTIVLAHGRPSAEAIRMLHWHPNTFLDTAFMPIEQIKELTKSGLKNRLLYGSDFPVQRFFYPNHNETQLYKEHWASTKSCIGKAIYQTFPHKSFST